MRNNLDYFLQLKEIRIMNTDCAAVKTLLSWFPASISPIGDGTYRVSPIKPTIEYTPLQAGKVLGVSRSQIYAYLGDGTLTCRRPARYKILIPAEQITELYERTKDPEHWG